VDLVLCDPPYEFKDNTGGGAFGTIRGKAVNSVKNGRKFRSELESISHGITDDVLVECLRICKIPNIYLFCNKDQIPQYLNFAVSNKLNFDIITWHKSNPVPACGNKYLSDTEYIIFMRGKGARIYGSYETKRKWYVTKTNKKDKELYGHPTCKPVDIVKNFIINSSQEGGLVCDPFMGSGTTAIAAIRERRNYIGFEMNTDYWQKANERIQNELIQGSLF